MLAWLDAHVGPSTLPPEDFRGRGGGADLRRVARDRQRADVAPSSAVDERVAARGGSCRTSRAPSRGRPRSPSPAPPCGTTSAAARVASLARGALAGRSACAPPRAMLRPALDVDADLEAVGQRDQRALAGVGEVEAQPRRRPARACRAGRRSISTSSGSEPEARAEQDPQRGAGDDPARARARALQPRPHARARRRSAAPSRRRTAPSAPARPARPRRCTGVIDYARQLARMLDKVGGRYAWHRGRRFFLFLQISGRSGPPSRSSE